MLRGNTNVDGFSIDDGKTMFVTWGNCSKCVGQNTAFVPMFLRPKFMLAVEALPIIKCCQ